jgi:hypothetical protein
VGQKLPDEHIPIRFGFGEEQNPGGKPVDAMDDEGPLSADRKSTRLNSSHW